MRREARVSGVWRSATVGHALALATAAAVAQAAAPSAVSLSFGPAASTPSAPWRVVGLPQQTKPYTTFAVVDLDGHHALRVQSDAGYGNLVHPVAAEGTGWHLAWQWRVDQLIEANDLRTRGGDDNALKVCVSFDLPMDKVPFIERQFLHAAAAKAGEPVPTATICYVWDAHLAIGTTLDNAYTRRLRYKVLETSAGHLRHWVDEQVDLDADFKALFGADDGNVVPAVTAVEVGADADNTHARSLGYVAGLALTH